jgi:hypothetical protein
METVAAAATAARGMETTAVVKVERGYRLG